MNDPITALLKDHPVERLDAAAPPLSVSRRTAAEPFRAYAASGKPADSTATRQ